jgi:nicotinate-nucleotide pyrophosphorylase (carboxylating)
MTAFDPPQPAVEEVVARALAEDLGVLGDITSAAVIDRDARGTGHFVARAAGVLAGRAAVTEVFRQVDATVAVHWQASDGAELVPGQAIATVEGPLRSLLAAERTALNLLQHCSGVATLTRHYVRATHGRARILDTRKTLPGLRALEKAAVRAGGGHNHRDSLSDQVLIKDNHVVQGAVGDAVRRALTRWPGRPVICECDTLAQVTEAAAAGATRILLDNMTPAQVAEAVGAVRGAVPLEVSGGVTLDTVGAYAAAGTDFISVGAITHSAPALDIGLDLD